MSRQFFPTPQNDKEVFTIALEDQQFTINYDYNPRSDTWYLTLTKDSVHVLDNVKLTWGYKFGYNYVDFPLTAGSIVLYSPNSDTDAPNKANFGKTVFLVYES